MKLHTSNKLQAFLVICFILLFLGINVSFADTDWSQLKGCHLSSLAWSPDANSIGFVAIPDNHVNTNDEYPEWADIWLLDLKKSGNSSIKKLMHIETKDKGIPTSLFWLSDHEIAWSGSADNKGFFLYSMNLDDLHVRRLIQSKLMLRQSRAFDTFGPDDLYYDMKSKDIIMSGHVFGGTIGESSTRTLFIYQTDTQSLDVVPLPVDIVGTVSVCGRIGEKPLFYIAGEIMQSSNAGSTFSLWRSNSWYMKQGKVIAKDQGFIIFPRLSPNSKWLTWLWNTDDGVKIFLHNIASGSSRPLTNVSFYENIYLPGMGCPYCWSPKNNVIAYASGYTIKFLNVTK